jgi:hypothetical protein
MEPAAVLGPAHPLTRAMQAGHGVARRALVVAMTRAAAITASVSGIAWAPAVALAAAVVLAGLGAVALRFRLHANQAARDLIAGGREALPLAPVQRERRRLLGARNRTALATSLERLSAQATTSPSRFAPNPPALFDVRVARQVADELRSIAAALRAGPASARGIALVEHLASWGGSSLYGHDVEPLRDDLGRVRYLLEQS